LNALEKFYETLKKLEKVKERCEKGILLREGGIALFNRESGNGLDMRGEWKWTQRFQTKHMGTENPVTR
jgi:hypothetical protein